MEKVLLEHCLDGCSENLESLLKRGISPNIALNASRQTVFVAVCKIYNCLVLGKDISILGELRNSIEKWTGSETKQLHLKFHLEKVIKVLVQYGGSPEYSDVSGNNGLQLCAETRSLDIFKCFIDKGINPNIVDVNKNSVLHLALSKYNGDPDAFTQYAINKGVHVNAVNKAGLSALHLAAQYGHVKCTLVLVTKGADVNLKSMSGDTPLILACVKKPRSGPFEQGNSQIKRIVEILLEKGADVDICNKSDRTALHHAAICSQNQLIKQLIQGGANVNIQDVKQKTPLHYYLEQGKVPVRCSSQQIELKTVCAFLDAGAKIMVKDSSGQTPLCCMFLLRAMDMQLLDSVIKLFLQAGLLLSMIPKSLVEKLQVFVLESNNWELIEKTIVVYGWNYSRDILLHFDTEFQLDNKSPTWTVEKIETLQNCVRPLCLLTADKVRHLLHKNAFFGVRKLPIPVILKDCVCPT